MKKYPRYKDSGIDWIGEIPVHWEKTRLKYIGYLYSGLTGKSGEDFKREDDPRNRPFINFTNICNNTYITRDNVGQVSINEGENQNRVEKGDLFFLMSSETQDDVGKSSVLKDEPGELYLNSFCKGFRLVKNEFEPNCINYILTGDVYRKLLSVDGKGFTRINLRQDKVNDFIFFYPPNPEQKQIVEFLDHKSSLIDTLIEKKLRKIELLKEQRTSIINYTVTKGLNPNVRMKDSGVEWIGEIPENWSCIFIRHYYQKIGSGVTPRGGSEVYVENGVIFIRSQNVHFDGLHLDDVVKITSETHNLMSGSRVQKGDLLLNITGGSIGRCCVVDLNEELNVNQHVCIIRTKDSLRTVYLNYFIQSDIGQNQLEFFITGGNREGLTGDNIKNFRVPLPSRNEQQQIVDYLDNKTNEIDTSITLENNKIELLKEYRQSLISEVVTGKIDVRKN